MSAPIRQNIRRRVAGGNVWLSRADSVAAEESASLPARKINYEVLPSEEAVGRAMLEDLEEYARAKQGDCIQRRLLVRVTDLDEPQQNIGVHEDHSDSS